MPFISRISALVVLAVSVPVCVAASPGDIVGSSASLTLDHHTQVPGETLKAGEYSIQILDQLSDRMIIRIDSKTSKDHAIFLGVMSTKISQMASRGAISWTGELDGQLALRGFSFPSGASVEFVYPKLQAVQLAKKNNAKVVAIDPDSQELPSLKKMSTDDLKIVNLWTLSLTTVGTDKKPNAVLAERYEPSSPAQGLNANRVAPQAPSSDATQVASLETPSFSPADTPGPTHARRAPMKVLPKTGSIFSEIFLAGVLSLFAAGILRLSRVATERA